MVTVESPIRLWEEIAELIASQPSAEQLLTFRPSNAAIQRASELLGKLKGDGVTLEERRELDQYEQAELLMRLVKAQIRARAT